jgi:hypothetical protein
MGAVEIVRAASAAQAGAIVADRRLYETASGQPCEEGDPAAAYLLVAGPGDLIPAPVAQRLKLRIEKDRVTWGAAPAARKPTEASPPAPELEPNPAPTEGSSPPALVVEREDAPAVKPENGGRRKKRR